MENYQPPRLTVLLGVVFLGGILLTAGCSDDPSADHHEPLHLDPLPVEQIMTSQLAMLQEAIEDASHLAEATEAFLNAPGSNTRTDWQHRWVSAHNAWLVASMAVADDGQTIDPWPVQPGFFDSLPEYPESGIVNDLTLAIESSELRNQHHITDESEVTLGFHVIEYYAFEREQASFDATDVNAERRKLLVSLVMQMLVSDMERQRQRLLNATTLDPLDVPDTASELLRILESRLQSVSQEYRSLEHSEFSQRVPQDVRLQLVTLKTLFLETSSLDIQLARINSDAARVLNDTLEEAIGLVPESGPLPEASSARMTLLLSALTHQVADFVRLLPGET